MEQIYNRIGRWDAETRNALWRRWLWECDCNALPIEQCYDMNEMHALGVLACLGEHAQPVGLYAHPLNAETVGGPAVVHLHPTMAVALLSLRETIDQIECLQLHWGPAIGDWGAQQARVVLRALMARIGEIAHHAYPIGLEEILDDPQHTTPIEGSSLGVVSRKSLRQAICVFFALLRVCAIVERAEPVPASTPDELAAVLGALRQHHIESASDRFNELQQVMYLAPGQRLAYRTLFAGMYNDVSQVIYFHHPRYCRKPQLELSRIPASPMHMLPLVEQLLPDVPIVYDDDNRLPFVDGVASGAAARGAASGGGGGGAWRWLICCGAVFLLEGGRIWSAPTLGELVAYHLRATGKTFAAADDDGASAASARPSVVIHTPSSHVQLL